MPTTTELRLPGRGPTRPQLGQIGRAQSAVRPALQVLPRDVGAERPSAALAFFLFIVVNAGANIEQLLLMTLNDMNDVPNAPRATYLTPRVPDDNTKFLRGIQLLATLRRKLG